MGREGDVVGRSDRPITPDDVAAALAAAGAQRGGTVIVHSSLSRLGWVVGGAHGLVSGILQAVGPEGDVVMAAQTGISDPRWWQHPPVPPSWWPVIRESWPAFDPRSTPLRSMGAVVASFAAAADAVHSGHPAVGFVARGPHAAALMLPHELEAGLGDGSPLGRLYAAGARIVLIGVGHGNDTSLHLAEHRAGRADATWRTDGAPMVVDGERRWVEYRAMDLDESDFETIAAAFEEAGGEQRRAPLGLGVVTSCDMRELIDFATEWIATRRVR